jgi:phospholipid/cholesterol/gamma-HCH transport system substrate-binding protein
MNRAKKLAVWTGSLVLVGVVLAFAIVVLLGRDRMWFHKKITIHAVFPDVGGLQEGAAVLLGGREIGLVTHIDFASAPSPDRAVVVSMRLRQDYARWIHEDSHVRIGTQGLLGDKLVTITVGSPHVRAVSDGDQLLGEGPADPNALIAVATDAAGHARDLLARLDDATRGSNEEDTKQNARDAIASIADILAQIERGPGSLHELIYGPSLVDDLRRAAANLDATTAQTRRLVASIRTDDGARDVLVDADRTVRSIGNVADAIDHQALRRASRDLADIVAYVKSGKGSLGGLIMDPTLYEATKTTIVGISRNRLLRLAARFVIKKHDTSEFDANPTTVDVTPRHAPKTQVQAGAKPKTKTE